MRFLRETSETACDQRVRRRVLAFVVRIWRHVTNILRAKYGDCGECWAISGVGKMNLEGNRFAERNVNLGDKEQDNLTKNKDKEQGRTKNKDTQDKEQQRTRTPII